MRMSKTYMVKMRFIEGCWSILFVMLLCMGVDGYAQTYPVRKYMNFQGVYEGGFTVILLGSRIMGEVVDPENAVNGVTKSFSTLKLVGTLLGSVSATQFLAYSSDKSFSNIETLAAGTKITIKFTIPSALLGLMSGVEVGWFKGLQKITKGADHNVGYNTGQKTIVYDGVRLLDVVSGSGDVELTITPEEDFQGVYLTLNGGLISSGLENNLYHAFIAGPDYVSDAESEKVIDVLYGTKKVANSSLSLLSLLGGVTNPVTNPYSLLENPDSSVPIVLNGTLKVETAVFHTSVFATPSKPNRIAKVVIRNLGGGILDAALLSKLVIQPYLGDQPVGDSISDETLLSLRLFGETGAKHTFLIPVASSFDRIEVRLVGTLNVGKNVEIHEVSRTFSFEADSTLAGCEELSLYDALIDPDPNLYTYYYYNSPTDGSPRSGGATVTQSGTYYIEAVEQGTLVKAGQRMAVVATVLPMPGKPHLTISNEIN